MKRSEINAIMRAADDFIRGRGFYLPPFAYWTADEWAGKGREARGVVENHLGWDITDFGSQRYKSRGLFLFTVRNGSQAEMKARKGKLYSEKILVVGVDQVTPMHFHWNKVEDIINRGGGDLMIRVYNASTDDRLENTQVTVSVDGTERVVRAGDKINLGPGESITLPQRLYHEFWGAKQQVLVGEVALAEEQTDDLFLDTVARFPEIDEDEPPLYLLVSDYPKYVKWARA